jgi:hypothetical protein
MGADASYGPGNTVYARLVVLTSNIVEAFFYKIN